MVRGVAIVVHRRRWRDPGGGTSDSSASIVGPVGAHGSRPDLCQLLRPSAGSTARSGVALLVWQSARDAILLGRRILRGIYGLRWAPAFAGCAAGLTLEK